MWLGSIVLSSTDISLLDLPLFPLLSPAPVKCTEAASDLNIVPPPLRPTPNHLREVILKN